MEQQFTVIYYLGGDTIGTTHLQAPDRLSAQLAARQLFPRGKVGVLQRHQEIAAEARRG